MKRFLTFVVLIPSLLIIIDGCAVSRPDLRRESPRRVPQAEQEFRAVWVATVGNIDWPSKPGLSTEEQQREARAILDTVASLNLNAVIFQVRPHADAMYLSELEPWSYYLTGEQGKAPDPFYDPLQFWVKEAHDRGLELHVWFNPYRAHLRRGADVTPTSIVHKRPDLAKKTDNNTYWLDPGFQEVQDISYNVVMDVVKRYDVDGAHFDDYFYPYGDGNFPDDDSYDAYKKLGGTLERNDWRRQNVNTFIERVYEGIKKEKRHVKFGISPFGIWRPSNPPSIEGYDQYDRLYADARLWLNEGWVDYWTPQLYWPISQVPQSFPVLLSWWARENTKGRSLWPGMNSGRMVNTKGMDEVNNQIMIARGFAPEAPGHVHFSMRAFMRDSTLLRDGLRGFPYKKQALVPPSPWLDNSPPAIPKVETNTQNDTLVIAWSHKDELDVFRWVLYYQYGARWEYTIMSKHDRTMSLPLTRTAVERLRTRAGQDSVVSGLQTLARIALSAVDRTGNESEAVHQTIGSDSGGKTP